MSGQHDDAAVGVGDDPASTSTSPGRSRGVVIAVVVALLLIPLGIAGVIFFGGGDDTAPKQYVIEVEAGMGARIDAGENLQLMPPLLELNVGDQLLVKNNDDRIHTVGPFTVRPGESLLQVFAEPGIIEGACTLNPEQGVQIVVT